MVHDIHIVIWNMVINWNEARTVSLYYHTMAFRTVSRWYCVMTCVVTVSRAETEI